MPRKCRNKIWEGDEVPIDWKRAVIIPIHKKKNKLDCNNYRGISLLSHPGKVLTSMIQERLKQKVEEIIGEEQAGFRTGRGTIDQLFTIRQLAEKYIEANPVLYNNFIDYSQAFDSVWQEGLWKALRAKGISKHLVYLIKRIYEK